MGGPLRTRRHLLRAAYTTIGSADAELEIERSRFICWLRRVESEDVARRVIAEARETHRQANHHCSAFVVGPDAALRRSNDDGEPAGTAGRPMLDALAHAGVSDVVAVGTRYFGGVKLGTGGLARAYAGAVAEALDRARRVRRVLMRESVLTLPHADSGRVEHALRADGITVLNVAYGAEVAMTLAVPEGDDDALASRLAALGVGDSLRSGKTRWHDA